METYINTEYQHVRKGETMNTEFEKAYEAAHNRYADIEARKAALPPKDKALIEKIEGINVGEYDMTFREAEMICNVYNNNAFNACVTFFKYGFLKGQRAAKAEMKDKENREKALR